MEHRVLKVVENVYVETFYLKVPLPSVKYAYKSSCFYTTRVYVSFDRY